MQGLLSHKASIELLVLEKCPELMCCTETHVTEEIYDSEIQIDGNYRPIRSNSLSRHSAGVVIYVKPEYTCTVIEDRVFGFNNIIVVDILNGLSYGRWICVYHSPNESHSQFISELSNVFESYLTTTLPIRVIGDFNINMHRNNNAPTYKAQLSRLLNQYSLSQIVHLSHLSNIQDPD